MQTTTEIFENLTPPNTVAESTYLPQDSPVSLFQSQEHKKALMMNALYGQKTSELFESASPIGLFSKMLLASSAFQSQRVSLRWRMKRLSYFIKKRNKKQSTSELSNESLTICTKQDTYFPRIPKERQSFLLSQLVPSTHRTDETECLLWPTVMASDATSGAIIGKNDQFKITKSGMPRKINGKGTEGSGGLARLVQIPNPLLPTPIKSDAMGGAVELNEKGMRKVGAGYSGSLKDYANAQILPTPRAGMTANISEERKYDKNNNLESQLSKILLPTVTEDSASNRKGKYKQGGKPLSMVVNGLLPTPLVRDFQAPVSPEAMTRKDGKLRNDSLSNLPTMLGEHAHQRTGPTSQLNPRFVAEMMGFPPDWTISPFQSGEQSQSKATEMP